MTAPSNANTSGLAPCPFCGGAPGVRQAMGETWVVCGSCSASTQSKGRETVAFDLWNRRAAPASPLPGGGPYERWSILNHLGESWTPENFDTERQATAFLDRWKRDNPKMDLSKHKVIPVLVTMTAAPTGEPK